MMQRRRRREVDIKKINRESSLIKELNEERTVKERGGAYRYSVNK